MHIPSLQPTLSNAQSMSRFKGCYALVGLRAKLDKYGNVYWEVDICDHDTCLTLFARTMEQITQKLAPFQFIQVEVKRKIQHGITFFIADFIEPIVELPFELANESLIPYLAAINAHDFLSLFNLLSQIKNQALLNFIREVLLQSNVMLSFLRNPASTRFHHNYPGGLLAHSIEVASRASSDNIHKTERELLIVAGLLHDIGKVRTHNTEMSFTELGQYILHDAMTLEICANPLKRLESKNPHFAYILRHCWTCATPNARYGMKIKHNIASLLQHADKQSVGL